MPAEFDKYTSAAHAISFIKKCWLPKVTFYVRGPGVADPQAPVLADMKAGRVVRELDGANIQHFKSKVLDVPQVLVRIKGMFMFGRRQPQGVKGTVMVDVTGSPTLLLEANRNGFRDEKLRDALDDYMAELAADVIGALKVKKNIIRQRARGRGKFLAAQPRQIQAAILERLGDLQPRKKEGEKLLLDQEQVQAIQEALQQKGGIAQADDEPAPVEGGADQWPPQRRVPVEQPLDMRPPADAVEVMLDVPMNGADHVAAAAKQLAWQPDFYIWNDIEDFHVPKKFGAGQGDTAEPEHMTPQMRKLARFWAEMCRFVLIQLGSVHEYGIGWVFSYPDRFENPEDSYTKAMFVREDGEDWLLLNPFKDGDPHKEQLYSMTDKDDINWLYAAAVHECTHLADGVYKHNEAFASALTENIAKTANRGPQINKIRASVVARGAKVGGLGALAIPRQAPRPARRVPNPLISNPARHPKNKTRYKVLDKLAADPRVEEIWDEGPDGLWVSLVDGYNWEGCSTLHEWNVADLVARMKEVEKGDPS